MKRLSLPLFLCLVVALTPAQAQDYDAAAADRAAAMERMERLMTMHERFMSDSLYRAHMMADTSMQAAMEMMSPEVAALHEKMAMMDDDARMEMMAEMHADMMARVHGMSPEEVAVFHARMMEAHDHAMADPELHDRMMADPELMEMHHEMMGEDGMMHHEGMDEHHEDMMEKHDEMHDGAMEDDIHERMEDDG